MAEPRWTTGSCHTRAVSHSHTHIHTNTTGILTWQMLMPRSAAPPPKTYRSLLTCLITGWPTRPLDSSIQTGSSTRGSKCPAPSRWLGISTWGTIGIRLNDPALGESLHHIFSSFPSNTQFTTTRLAVLQGLLSSFYTLLFSCWVMPPLSSPCLFPSVISLNPISLSRGFPRESNGDGVVSVVVGQWQLTAEATSTTAKGLSVICVCSCFVVPGHFHLGRSGSVNI
jgi:hypothetical protein